MQVFTDWNQFWTALLNALLPVLFAGLGLLCKVGFSFLKEKTNQVKNVQLRDGLMTAQEEAYSLVTTIVSAMNQTVVESLKTQNGGKLSAADAIRVKNEAVSKIKNILSDETKKILSERSDITEYIGNLIEAIIHQQKSSQ